MKIGFVRLNRADEALGEYASLSNQVGGADPGRLITLEDLMVRERIPVRLEKSILSSDEALVGTLAHKMHEVNELVRILGERGAITLRDLARMINARHSGGMAGNLHEQAWDATIEVVRRMRSEEP